MKKKTNYTQILRHVIQLTAFLLFPGLFFSVFTALRDVITSLIFGSFSFSALSRQLILLLVVFLFTALWGRFFCSNLCSFGAMQELIHWISGRLFPKIRAIPSRVDRLLKYVKYSVLSLIVVLVWILQFPVRSDMSPWGVFGMLVSGNLTVMRMAIPTVGFFALIAIIIGSFFVERFFCRYLCPLGALFAILSNFRLFRIRRIEKACTSCARCSRTCAMGLTIHKSDQIQSGECIDCMRCISECPCSALQSNPHPALAGTAAALMMCTLVKVGDIAVSAAETSVSATESSVSATGTSEVYTIPRETSEASSASSETSASRESSEESDTSSAASTLQASTEESDTSSADSTFQASSEESDASASETSAYADGEYTGSGTGLRGTTQVSVTVEGGLITGITVLSYEDDREYFLRARDTVISEIINSQGIDVSTVSGATFSSNGILEAVADALDIDFTNPNSSADRGHKRR